MLIYRNADLPKRDRFHCCIRFSKILKKEGPAACLHIHDHHRMERHCSFTVFESFQILIMVAVR